MSGYYYPILLFFKYFNFSGGEMQKRTIYIFILLFFIDISKCYSADPYHLLETKTYNSDSSIATDAQNITAANKISQKLTESPENAIIKKSGQETLSDKPRGIVAIESSYQSNIKTTNIPLSYGIPVSFFKGEREFLNFSANIPYTERELGSAKESGLGDISIKTNYLIKLPKLLFDSTLMIKFPTGEVKDADVALGTGSTDIGFNIKSRFYFNRFALDGMLGYTLNGDYSDNGSKIEYGNEYIIGAGGEYNISEDLSSGCKFIYNSHSEDKFKTSGFSSDSPGINTFDFIPSITYTYKKFGVGINFQATIPVSDSWNGSGAKPSDPDRDIEFKIKLAKPF